MTIDERKTSEVEACMKNSSADAGSAWLEMRDQYAELTGEEK